MKRDSLTSCALPPSQTPRDEFDLAYGYVAIRHGFLVLLLQVAAGVIAPIIPQRQFPPPP